MSGLFFPINRPNFKHFLKKKFKRLIIPYISFGLLSYLIWILLNINDFSLEPLFHLLFYNNDGLPYSGALWFLTSIFFAEIIEYIIRFQIQKDFIQNIVTIILCVIGCLENKLFPFRLPLSLGAALVGVGLIQVGCIFRDNNKIKKLLSEIKFPYILLLGLLTLVLIFINGPVNMREGNYSFIPLFWSNAISSIIICLNISAFLDKHFFQPVDNILGYIGRNSIVYLCLNQITILFLSSFIEKIIIQVVDVYEIITIKIIELIFVLLILWVITEVFNHTKLKFFI